MAGSIYVHTLIKRLHKEASLFQWPGMYSDGCPPVGGGILRLDFDDKTYRSKPHEYHDRKELDTTMYKVFEARCKRKPEAEMKDWRYMDKKDEDGNVTGPGELVFPEVSPTSSVGQEAQLVQLLGRLLALLFLILPFTLWLISWHTCLNRIPRAIGTHGTCRHPDGTWKRGRM